MKMDGNRKSTSFALLAAGLLLMGIAGRQNGSLVNLRAEHNLIEEVDPLVGASPWVRFIQVGLGGFRGVLVDILWTRATRLQDENKYFELTQLSDWISKLEPRVPEVWAFHAWNQAYNISVLFNTPEERWQWVRNGITLLRDDGLRYNPNSAALHWELGWLYQHKMGADLDNMHRMYKLYWANEMAVLFPSNAPPYEVWLEYPQDVASLEQINGMSEFLNELRAAEYEPTADAFLDQFVRGEFPDEQLPRILDKHGDRVIVLINYLRIQRLQKVYKLELATMKEVDDKYGPFDWRLPQAHSTYWAYKGLPRAKRKDALRLNRMIYQSMGASFRYGKFTVIDDHLPPDFSPNLDILDNTLKAYQEALDQFENVAVDMAQSNLMVDAVVILSEYGQKTRARELYADFRERYPNERNPPYETFVLETLFQRDISSLGKDEATHIIEGKLREGYVHLATGQKDRAEGYFFWAKRVYDQFSARASPENQRLAFTRTWQDFLDQARKDALSVFRSPQRRAALENPPEPEPSLEPVPR